MRGPTEKNFFNIFHYLFFSRWKTTHKKTSTGEKILKKILQKSILLVLTFKRAISRAFDPEFSEIRVEASQKLRAGWRAARIEG